MYEIKIDKVGVVVQILQCLNPNLRFEKKVEKTIRVLTESKSNIVRFRILKNWDFDTETALLMGGEEESFSYRLIFETLKKS